MKKEILCGDTQSFPAALWFGTGSISGVLNFADAKPVHGIDHSQKAVQLAITGIFCFLGDLTE